MNEHLNSELIHELKELMEDEFSLLLETYLQESEKQFTNARSAWEEQDLDALMRFAHSLKGSSSNIGAERLSSLCGRLESGAKQSEREGLPDLLAEVAAELADVRNEVQAMHSGL
ncbi:MAG: Hpt domain-containing protein [Gammaproteobacteria bacterium]|nr:Hpt domain-containing protein [Gammaproteobacteria bacterium]